MADSLAAFDAAVLLSPSRIDRTATVVIGRVTNLHYQTTRWCAGRLEDGSGRDVPFTVKSYVMIGDKVTLKGQFTLHSQFGWQFTAVSAHTDLTLTAVGVAAWIEWNVKGVGEKRAAQLIEKYGVDVMDAFANTPHEVASFARITSDAVSAAAAKWREQRGQVGIITALAAYGLTSSQCERIFDHYGDNALAILRNDPYDLAGEVEGIGFKLADEIAGKLGIVGTDPRRLRGGLAAFVRERHSNGHTATPVNLALTRTAELLDTTPDLVEKQVAPSLEGKSPRLARLGQGHATRDVLASFYGARNERVIAEVLAGSRQRNPLSPCREGEESEYAEGYRQCGTITLGDDQLAAVVNALRYRITALTGSAGGGKSTISRAIIKAFLPSVGENHIYLAAPTGKAGRRLSVVVGMEGQTIHRLLEWRGRAGGFGYGPANQLPRALYVLDEMSMTDSTLAYAFFSALGEDSACVLIGDIEQLPPVGPGAVLRDILAHQLAPVTRLTTTHRQAGTLLHCINAILAGEVRRTVPSLTGAPPWVLDGTCDTDHKILSTILDYHERILPGWDYDAEEWVFLAPKLAGPCGVQRINLVLQWLNQKRRGNKLPHPGNTKEDWAKRPTFHVGDRVIATRNDYNLAYTPLVTPTQVEGEEPREHRGVMNGNAGVVIGTDPLTVLYSDLGTVRYANKSEAADVQLAYCLSVHRSQGSQYRCTIVVVPKSCSGFVTRNLLYTAASRSMMTTAIIGDGSTIRDAAQRTTDNERETVLRWIATQGEEE